MDFYLLVVLKILLYNGNFQTANIPIQITAQMIVTFISRNIKSA